MNNKILLLNLGLTDTESEIYTTLLSADVLSAAALAKETGIGRTTIYHALETLEQKGLVTERAIAAKLNYSANSPKTLNRLLDHRMQAIHETKKELENYLPELLKQAKSNRHPFRVSQSNGIEGIKMIIEEALYCHSRKWEIIAPAKNFFSEFDPDYAKYFINTRVENGIIARSLWESTFRTGHMLTADEIARRNPRILPKVMHGKFKTVILLFDDKIAFIPSLKEKTAVLMQSEELQETMHAVFDGLWSCSTEYKK